MVEASPTTTKPNMSTTPCASAMHDLMTQAAAMCDMLEDAAMSLHSSTMPADKVASYAAVLGALVGKAQSIGAELDGPNYLVLPSDCPEGVRYLRRIGAEA